MTRPLLGLTLALIAALSPGAAEPAGAQAPRLEDTVALGSFIDGVMQAHLDQLRMPAAVVAIVKGDRVLYARGYGHADLAKGTPIDPSTSLFHIGSTGKLFTWTAVMQLVEAGKLDLDADVNRYLKTFQIPRTFPQPITLRHLMTHTAGFQEGILGYFIGNDSIHIRSIEETLRRHVPARVRPPGELASYSNYGASLAGLIVEQVSGEPFAEYVERHIYQPLGIRYATFREPLPPALRPHAVIGYALEDGVFVPQPFEIDGGFVPAGGTVMSALDMARFMIAHLHDGQYGDTRILSPETARLMHRTAFAHDPRLPGLTLGFIEQLVNGWRVIGHDGDSEFFHVEMFLVPDQQVGLFVGYGGDGGIEAREGLKRAFFDRFFPATDTVATASTAPPAEKYAGDYRMIRMNYTDIDKLVYLFAPTTASVSALPAGRLLVSGGALGPGSPSRQFTPIGENLFQEVGGDRRIAFREEPGGTITRLFLDPTVATERVPWNERRSLWYPALILSLLVLLTVLTGLYYRRREIGLMPPTERRALRLSGATVGWLLLTVAAVAAVVAIYRSSLLEHIPFALKAVLAMPLIFVGLTLGLVATTARAWRGRYWSVGRRIHFTLVTLAALVLCWFFYQWNILGWQFG